MSTAQGFLFFLLLLGVAAAALRLLSRTTPTVPYPVLLAVGGVLIGLVPGLRLPAIGSDLILLAFVPGLVFEASLSLDLDELRRRVLPISLLATAGVFLTVVLIGVLTHLFLGLDWAGAFLLGAIVAATDPIAVVGLLRQLRAPKGLEAILDGESLFNDGTGVAVFAAVLGTIVAGHPSVLDASVRFVLVTAGGTGIGLVVGLAGLVLVRLVKEAELEVLTTLVVAYGSYLAADLIHASGVVAVVVAGLVVARHVQGTQLHGFWNLLAFLLNAILFLVIGIAMPAQRLVAVAGPVLGAYLIMLIARAVAVYGLLGAFRSIPWRWRHMTMWGGLRGGLSVALALSVASYPTVPVLAYGMILLSLIVQGGLLLPVADLLRLRARPVD